MKSDELNDEKKIPYQFTANPLNLMYIMDSECLKLLNLLIQEESYWRSQGKLVDGYFFKSILELKADMFMSNDHDVRLTIEALYANGIIDVIPQGNMHKASKFKINMEKVMEYDSKTITDVKKFCPRICKLPRKSACSYMKRNDSTPKQSANVDTKCSTDCIPDCTPKLEKSDSLYKSDLLNKSDCLNKENKIEDNIIDNNIINNENFKKESSFSLNNDIDNRGKMTVDTNNQQVIDAFVPQADAQNLVSTKKENTKEDSLINFIDHYNSIEQFKEKKDWKTKDQIDSSFRKEIDGYRIEKLKYLNDCLENVSSVNDDLKGHIRFRIELDKMSKREELKKKILLSQPV